MLATTRDIAGSMKKLSFLVGMFDQHVLKIYLHSFEDFEQKNKEIIIREEIGSSKVSFHES